jgi:hypothetical protein
MPVAAKAHTLRIYAPEPFRSRWSVDNSKTWRDNNSHPTNIGGEYFDVPPSDLRSQIKFTFFWISRKQWEGRNCIVEAQEERDK